MARPSAENNVRKLSSRSSVATWLIAGSMAAARQADKRGIAPTAQDQLAAIGSSAQAFVTSPVRR